MAKILQIWQSRPTSEHRQGDMTKAETTKSKAMWTKKIRRPTVKLTLLLVTALGASTSTVALAGDMPDLDADMQGHADATSSLLDSPAAPVPVVVKPPEQPPAAIAHAPSANPPRANPLWVIPLATLSNTRERPIFSSSRRPPPAVASVPVPKAPPPKPARVEHPPLSLVGTIISDDQSFGIFLDPSTKAALRLKIGEIHQGWMLRSVQSRAATLERDQQTEILNLPEPGSGGTAQASLWVAKVAIVVPADLPPRDGDRH
jgi:general secretion pathway protein N